MATKRYADQYGHATAIVMRLSEEAGMLGTKRTVYGDSFFASVEICQVLASNGLYFKGIVKQSYSKYPKMFLQEWYWLGSEQHARAAKQNHTLTHQAVEVAKSNEVLRAADRAELARIKLDPTLTKNTRVAGRKVVGTKEFAYKAVIAAAKQRSKDQNPHGTKNSKRKKHASIARGAHLVLVSTLPNGDNPPTNVMAVGWADQTLKCFVGTSGNTLAGQPHVRTTYKIVTDPDGQLSQSKRTSTVPRPACIQWMFNYFAGIDIHDHLRQGSLNLEKSWRTYSWSKRAYTTILGMTMTDAYLSWCQELPQHATAPTFSSFLGRLAYQLIHNQWRTDAAGAQQRPVRGQAHQGDQVLQPAAAREQHTLKLIRLIPGKEGEADSRRVCSVKPCKEKTSYYCAQCSTINRAPPHTIVAMCAPGERNKKRKSRAEGANTSEDDVETVTNTNPLCYKQHIHHCSQ